MQAHPSFSNDVARSRRQFIRVGACSAAATLFASPLKWAVGETLDEEVASSAAPQLQNRLRQELGEIGLVDAHEHLPHEGDWLSKGPDLVNLLGYSVVGDLQTAGMPQDALQEEMNADAVWDAIAPYWAYVRNMGSARLLRRALSLFFDVDELNRSVLRTVETELSSLMQPGVYMNLLRQRHKIEVCLNVEGPPTVLDQPPFELFAPLLYTSIFANVQKRSDIQQVEEWSDVSVYSLDTYLQAVDEVIDRCVERGLVGIKWHQLAYLRDIHYAAPDRSQAEQCFNRILQMPAAGGLSSDTAVGFDRMRPFQDLIQHHLVRRAIDFDMPVQIHTGILGLSRGAQISHTNPSHLTNLFLQYPTARFDLLHVSYPYIRELTAIAKLFPNVYINTSWFEVLSPRAAKQYLREWLSSVPTNKILAFGGDQMNVLLSCASAEIVRDILADALAEEVIAGNMSENQAVHTANALLRNNAWEYFRLERKWRNRDLSTLHDAQEVL
jgi:uncharacterized protein